MYFLGCVVCLYKKFGGHVDVFFGHGVVYGMCCLYKKFLVKWLRSSCFDAISFLFVDGFSAHCREFDNKSAISILFSLTGIANELPQPLF